MNLKKFLTFFLAAGILFLGFKTQVKADGAIMPPDDYYPVYETGQKAFIIYEDGKEELVISVSFSGKASDFGWVIPIPNKPEISKVDSSIFRKLSEATEPKDNLLDMIRGDSAYYPMYSGGDFLAGEEGLTEDKSTVEVIEEESIGIFDYAILKAGEVDDLKEWMEDNDYNLPSGEEDEEDIYWWEDTDSKTQAELWSDALPIFQDYIDEDWYFVTVKVNNEYTDSSGVKTQLEEGSIDPLRFSFETTDMIYPMKLTGLAQRSISVTLYVLDDHKVRVENYNYSYCSSDDEDCSYFDTSYAAKVKSSEIEELTKEVGKGSWYEPSGSMYITKLYAYNLSYEEMDEEVLFTDTSNNDGVNDGSMSTWEWVQLPFVLIVYLPYLIMGGFFELIGGSSYWGYGLETVWFLGVAAFLFIASIIWVVISLLLLRKARKKLIRLIIYALQFFSVWLIGLTLSFIIAVPFGLLVGVIAQNEGVMFIDGFCCLAFMIAFLPLVFYRLVWRRRGRRAKRKRKK
jgi:hypothetical protein